MLFDDSEEDPGVRGPGRDPGPVRRLAPGVKRRRCSGTRSTSSTRTSRCSPDSTSDRGSTSSTRSTACRRSRRRRRDVRLRRAGQCRVRVGQRVRHPVPPGEVGATAGRRLLANFVALPPMTARADDRTLYPAIDLRGGRVVRLREGDFAAETVYGDDPVAIATSFCRRRGRHGSTSSISTPPCSGEPRNRQLVTSIVSAVAGRANVQAGGVCARRRRAALAAAGVARVVMGSAALAPPGARRRGGADLRSPSGSITGAACSPWTAGRSRATSR